MPFECTAGKAQELQAEVLVCFTPKLTKVPSGLLNQINKAADGDLANRVESGEFTGAGGQVTVLMGLDDFAAQRVLLVGLGDKEKVDADAYRRAMGTLSRHRTLSYAAEALVFFDKSTDKAAYQAVAEGYLLGAFKHLDYKTGDDAVDGRRLKKLIFAVEDKRQSRALQSGVERGEIIAEGQILTRRLAATPSADLTPKLYAKEVQKLAKKYGFDCKILDEKAIAKEKMAALLGVAAGSEEPPRFIIMEHKGGRAGQAPIVLVGKGVTFDSGGISLKPGLNMHEMKQDMAGSAAVVAALTTAARLNIKQNIV
ncbi:hypothetical protein GF377_00005, partial [candidate division GN15 bacterium]|nr:hypothetical protein [candidate division GN15 bacterium]